MFEDDDDEDTDLILIDNAYAAVQKLIALTNSEHKKVALNILKEETARAEAKKEEEEAKEMEILTRTFQEIAYWPEEWSNVEFVL